MRAVIQRVKEASVEIEGNKISHIDKGILLLIGMQSTDDKKVMDYVLDKVVNLRIFEDEDDKMNLSLKDIKGQLLIVPNFTLYGDCRKGRRPSYSTAATVSEAKEIFERFVEIAKAKDIDVSFGQFQADMKVSLINDGPVTLLLDSDKEF